MAGISDRRAVEEDRGEDHRRHHRHRIGLEQVGGHAGAIADIVADVVGDGRRIARIVLGDAGLDLADEIGADVRALGEDAAAETGEDRDERGAEAERDQRVDRGAVRGAMAEDVGQNAEIAGDAEKREAGNEKPGHRAGAKGDVEAAGERFRRRLRGAHVGAHRDVHADEAGGARQDCADGEADRHRPRKQEPKDDEDDDADAGDGHVLSLEIGLRPLGDRAGNLLHARGAGVRRHEAGDRVDAIDDGKQPTDDNQAQKHARKPRCNRRRRLSRAQFWAPLARNRAPPQRGDGVLRSVLCKSRACGPAGPCRHQAVRPHSGVQILSPMRSEWTFSSPLASNRSSRTQSGRPAARSPEAHRPPRACGRPSPCTTTSPLARRGPSRRRCRPAAGWG